jgi:predicted nucleic acid-binding protein
MVSIVYIDTSALVKNYIVEAGSDWVKTLLISEQTPTVFTSHLTVVEATCALARRRRAGTLSPEDHVQVLAALDYDFTYRYNTIDVTPTIVDTACLLANRRPLRAYDAVQLATAWLAQQERFRAGLPPLTFVCADDRLISTAEAEGLLTENPNHHT